MKLLLSQASVINAVNWLRRFTDKESTRYLLSGINCSIHEINNQPYLRMEATDGRILGIQYVLIHKIVTRGEPFQHYILCNSSIKFIIDAWCPQRHGINIFLEMVITKPIDKPRQITTIHLTRRAKDKTESVLETEHEWGRFPNVDQILNSSTIDRTNKALVTEKELYILFKPENIGVTTDAARRYAWQSTRFTKIMDRIAQTADFGALYLNYELLAKIIDPTSDNALTWFPSKGNPNIFEWSELRKAVIMPMHKDCFDDNDNSL